MDVSFHKQLYVLLFSVIIYTLYYVVHFVFGVEKSKRV